MQPQSLSLSVTTTAIGIEKKKHARNKTKSIVWTQLSKPGSGSGSCMSCLQNSFGSGPNSCEPDVTGGAGSADTYCDWMQQISLNTQRGIKCISAPKGENRATQLIYLGSLVRAVLQRLWQRGNVSDKRLSDGGCWLW